MGEEILTTYGGNFFGGGGTGAQRNQWLQEQIAKDKKKK
jgi:hypothetical protein